LFLIIKKLITNIKSFIIQATQATQALRKSRLVTLSRSSVTQSYSRMDATIAMRFKEYMAKMPDDIDDKDIMAYSKDFFKEIKEEKKKLKAEEAEKKKNDKPKRVAKKAAVKVDEDGNVIPKKLTPWNQYIKDNQQRIKEKYPDLTNPERFTKLAEEWKEYKKTLVEEKEEVIAEVVKIEKEKTVEPPEEIKESRVEELAPKKKVVKKKA